MPRMVQPLRSDARTLDKPVSFRVTQAERDAIDRCAAQLGIPGLGGEAPEAGVRRAKAYRDLAAAADNGVILAGSELTDADRATLDRLVAEQEAQLARIQVQGLRPTRSSVLLSLLRAAEHKATAPAALDVKAFVADAPEHEAAVREAAAREAVAVTPAAEHEATAVTPAPAELHDVDVDALHAAFLAALAAGETVASIAAELEVSTSALRGFKVNARKGIGAERREDLARILRKKGHLKDGA